MEEMRTSTAAPEESSPGEPGFVQGLGLFDSTMIVSGSMIGSGIFIVSADIAKEVGSPFWLLFIWALSGLMTIIGALSFGELAAMMPRAGGQYVFLREAFGPLAGFLYGWTFFLVIQTGTIAAVGVAFAKFLGVFIPVLGEKQIVFSTGLAIGRPFAQVSSAQLLAIALVAFLTALNLRGIRTGKWVQNLFTTAKIGALAGLIAVGVLFALGVLVREPGSAADVQPAAAPPASPPPAAFLVVLGAAMVGALFSSDSWNSITFAAGEVRDPRRNIPRSLVLGASLVTVLYLGANVVYLAVLEFGQIAGAPEERVATAALKQLFGPPGAMIMAAAILVSTFGCNNGLVLTGARVLYAMGRDGLFFPGVGRLSRTGVPGRALLWQGAVASVMALSGTYGKLLDFVMFVTVLFYIVTVLGIFVLRRTRPEAPRPYRALGYPLLPALYIVLAAGVCAALLLHPDTRASSLIGLGIVAAGVPVYCFLKRSGSPAREPTGEPTS